METHTHLLRARAARALALLGGLALLAALGEGCGPADTGGLPASSNACQPTCAVENVCGDDGCGGLCDCPRSTMQTNGRGQSVPAEECLDSCDTSGWLCGDVCGENCGGCGAGDACYRGRCECEPTCDGTRCDDGCGGVCPCAEGTVCNAAADCVLQENCHDSCDSLQCGSMCGDTCGTCADSESCLGGACAPAVSCENCPLALKLLNKSVVDGKIREVTLGIDLAATDKIYAPRMVDVRIHASRPVTVVDATADQNVLSVGKELYEFVTGEFWKERPNGTHQLLILGTGSSMRATNGSLATVTFEVDEWGPVIFSLERRVQGFAPPAADGSLQGSRYDGQVIVTR